MAESRRPALLGADRDQPEAAEQRGRQRSVDAIRFDGVAVSYGREPVLHGVDGVVGTGRIVALVGPNGAGKTTLLRAVLGLARVSAGRITVLGGAPAQARRHAAYIPQADTLDADFPVTAGQVVLMGRYRSIGWLRRPGRADRQIAADALARVGLADQARRRFGLLSGGQRQRVLLARAIAQRPRLLLLDEPFSGVDGVSRRSLLHGLAGLRAEGVAIMVSTHDLALARQHCDEVCLLNRQQYGFGPAVGTLTADRLRAAYGSQFLDLGDGAVVGE